MSSAIHVLFLFISFGWEVIEPEAEVVDSLLRQCICTVNPPRPATPSAWDLYLVTPVYLIARKTVVAKDLVFFHLHVYTRV